MLNTDLEIDYLEKPAKEAAQKLVILLHGYGSNEEDLIGFSPAFPKDAIILSLRAPHTVQFGGYSWYDISFTASGKKSMDVAEGLQSKKQIAAFIKSAQKKYQITADKTSLMGFSQGAILSNATALTYPNLVKNVMMLSGYYEAQFIENVDTTAIQNLNYFVSHGTIDMVLPIDLAKMTHQKFKEIQLNHVFKTYNAGHTVDKNNYFDLVDWIQANL